LIGFRLPINDLREKGDVMAKLKPSANDAHETTLAKRVLNSNLSDDDKIVLIQLLGNHPNIISIPSVWTPYPQPLNPTYRGHDTGSPKIPPEYVSTCSAGNNACPHANVSCLEEV
jgi:hypothetical protein